MNELISNKRTAFLLLATLVVVILGAIYMYVIYPLQEEKNLKEVTVSNIRNEIAVLQASTEAPIIEDENEENQFALQQKVPLTRNLDELIRSIEEIELVSESKIESISFNNYDEIVADSNLAPTQTEEGEETQPEATPETDTTVTDETPEGTEAEEVSEAPVSPVANIVLPTQLKLITFNISVLTKDYDHLKMFMEELESMERIVRIDQLSFALPGEEQLFEMDSEETVSAQIQVTTFFYDEQQ